MDFSLFVVREESHNVFHHSPHSAAAAQLELCLELQSRDRAALMPLQETSEPQPAGVEQCCAAEPDVVGTGESTQRSCLFLPPAFMSLYSCQWGFTDTEHAV